MRERMKKGKKGIIYFALATVILFNAAVITYAASCTFTWNNYTVRGTLVSTGSHAAKASTEITNISAPAAYKVRALINAKQSKDGSGGILKQNYEDLYNTATVTVYHKNAHSFVSMHNIQNRGAVVKSNSLTIAD